MAGAVNDRAWIRFRDLKKSFGAKRVLEGVNLDLRRGETAFIVGPSGTGKSVLAKHLVGFIRADGGQIMYDGEPVHGMNEAGLTGIRRRCVYVFQHPTLFDGMTVEQNVRLVIQQHRGLGAEQARKAALGYLEQVGMAERADSRTQALAAGEQKRVSIARALAMEPETLVLDEPTTGLDPMEARRLDALTKRLSEGDTTLLIISHDLRSIHLLADRVVMLFKGCVHFDGSRTDFFGSDDPVVSQFVSGNPEGPV